MGENNSENIPAQIQILLNRLERIPADSPWAHQASGIRASLARHLADMNSDKKIIQQLIDIGYAILENAASEIPEG